MKKKILAAMLAALAVGAMALTGCSMGSGDSTESSSAVENSQVISSETVSSEETSEPETSSEETSEPDNVITEPVDFETKFADNPIDSNYNIRIAQAVTTLEMQEVESTFAGLWEAEIDHAYLQLIRLGAEGAEADQQNWNSSVESELQLIRDSVAGGGSLAVVERSMKAKNLYRDKAKSLYEQLYALDPDYTYIFAQY